MWHSVMTVTRSDVGRIAGIWLAPDGRELLVLTDKQTGYWRVGEQRALWTIREASGGEGRSPDGRLYRDPASGLFYPLLGSHGGRQLREHPVGGRIAVDEPAGVVTVTSPGGSAHDLSRTGDFGDWIVAGFCESGDHAVVAGPRCLVVYREDRDSIRLTASIS